MDDLNDFARLAQALAPWGDRVDGRTASTASIPAPMSPTMMHC